jgi:DME family drug/metabolite transporter
MLLDRHRSAVGSLSVAVAATLFGTLGPLSLLASEHAGVTTIGFVTWRSLFGAVVVAILVAVLTLRGRPFVGLGAISGRARIALLVATVSGVVLNLAIFAAFGRITVALALLGFYTYPAVVTVAVAILERRRPGRTQIVALGMATLGMAVVVVGGIDPASGLTFDVAGLLLAFGAALAQTVFILVSRHGYAKVPVDEASLTVLAGGFVGFLAVAVVAGQIDAVTGPIGNPGAWPYLLAGGVLGAGIPTTLFLVGVRVIGGVRAGILALIEPVVGTLLAAALLDETLRPIQFVGGVMVLAAALLLQRSPRRAAPPGAAPLDRSGDRSASHADELGGEPEIDVAPLI